MINGDPEWRNLPNLITRIGINTQEKSYVHLLRTEFDHPEVTLCGWQDIKIQLLTYSEEAEQNTQYILQDHDELLREDIWPIIAPLHEKLYWPKNYLQKTTDFISGAALKA